MSQDAARPARGAFRAGDKVQLTGPKGRMHTLVLRVGGQFFTDRGAIEHDRVIGAPDGSVVATAQGAEFLAFRPRLADEVISMPRGAAIIYPKDAAQMISVADIGPGAHVIEAGVGSGALTLWLLRAVGSQGSVVSFERREEFAQIAQANVLGRMGEAPAWTLICSDLAEALPRSCPRGDADAVMLDMLAPWEPLPQVTDALRPGGMLVCYVATVPQLSRVAEDIRATGTYATVSITETLVRDWHAEGLAVRPEHRMIAHTGFIVAARRLADGVDLPNIAKRPSKDAYDPESMERWAPGALGIREASDKRLRKTVRAAQRLFEERTAEYNAGRAQED